MDRTVSRLMQLLADGRTAVAATIIESRGSTPRSPGTTMILLEDGSFVGTVGGGAVEMLAQQCCRQAFAEKTCGVEAFDIEADCRTESAGDVPLTSPAPTDQSKGSQHLLFRFLDGRQQAVRRFAALLCENSAAGGGRWWVTHLTPGGCLNLVADSGGILQGQQFLQSIKTPSTDALLRSQPVLLRTEEDLWFSMPLGKDGLVYLFGAGHVARQLAAELHRVFFEVVLIDDRPELATRKFFPNVRDIFTERPAEALEHLPLTQADYVVAMTKGPNTDREVLAGALKTPVRYIGMLGSQRKIDSVFGQLSSEYGYTEQDFNRVHAPIGLDIGGETPEELAVGVVAELILVRSGKCNIIS